MHPTHMGPAITSETLIVIEQGALRMDPIEVRATPDEQEIGGPTEG
jgi:hypothetical protein